MELYQIIVTVNNTASTFTMQYLPENFEGVQIEQKFSFVNPIGYNPKMSVDTMRIILTDKSAIDTVFDTYGLQSDVQLEIKKLNTSGIGYSHLAYFSIDFESHEKMDEFSEFALKSISAMNHYENIKNTEMSIDLTDEESNLPNSIKYINYVSLRMKRYFNTNWTYIGFEPNNEAKLYDTDYSLFRPEFSSDLDTYVYGLGIDTPATDTIIRISGTLRLKFTGESKTHFKFVLRKITAVGDDTVVYTFFDRTIYITGTVIDIDFDTDVNLGSCNPDDVLIVSTDDTLADPTIVGDFFLDIRKQTNVKVLKSGTNKISFLKSGVLLDTIFNGNYYTTDFNYLDRGVTSANHLAKNDNFIKLKPAEFLSDFSKLLGLVVNAKLDGSVYIDSMETYFNNLLNTANAIEVTNAKDISIKYSPDLVFNSVSVGQEQKECEIYPFWLNWMKKLTFSQTGRFGVDDLDLSLTKFRADFAGIIDYYMKRSKQNDNNFNDAFIFDYSFHEYWYDGDFVLYDQVTPRRFLDNWSKFLSFAFQNYGLNTLTLSSNGGTPDNLDISGVLEMSNYTLNETTRLLPVAVNFTCAIDLIDYSENILKIKHKGEDMYVFVTNAKTTDDINEQEITGLKIQLT